MNQTGGDKINTVYLIYHSILTLWWLYFAIHDVKTHRIEPKARLLFLPYALLSLWPNTLTHQNSIGKALTDSLIGAVGAFLLLFFLGVLLTKKTEELAIGGGDIKIMAYVGFIYGAANTIFLVFLFSLFMLCGGIILKLQHKPDKGAAMPFIATACIVCSVLQGVCLLGVSS